MLIDKDTRQISMEFVSIEELVPKDHLLRKIDKAIDFGFIREKVRSLYCADNGRPAIDPVVLFKMLFIGYLFGVRSERQLVRDIQVNARTWRLLSRLPTCQGLL
jgi:transposase